MKPGAPHDDDRPTLFCLHAAGATSAMFAEVSGHLGGVMQVRSIDLPGRGTLFAAEPLRRVEDAVAHCLPVLREQRDGRYLILGYSMGALIGFELVHALLRAGGPLPATLIAVAARAPDRPARERPLHTQPDAVLLKELVHFQGTSPSLTADRELMALVLPRLRADFELCEAYRYRPGPRLPLTVHAIGGIDDTRVEAADLSAWLDQAQAGSTFERWPGGHFLIQQSGQRLARRVVELTGQAQARRTAVAQRDRHD